MTSSPLGGAFSAGLIVINGARFFCGLLLFQEKQNHTHLTRKAWADPRKTSISGWRTVGTEADTCRKNNSFSSLGKS